MVYRMDAASSGQSQTSPGTGGRTPGGNYEANPDSHHDYRQDPWSLYHLCLEILECSQVNIKNESAVDVE